MTETLDRHLQQCDDNYEAHTENIDARERQELERWRKFGHNAFMVLFTAREMHPDRKWVNDRGWMSSSALFSDLNNLLKAAKANTEAKQN